MIGIKGTPRQFYGSNLNSLPKAINLSCEGVLTFYIYLALEHMTRKFFHQFSVSSSLKLSTKNDRKRNQAREYEQTFHEYIFLIFPRAQQ